MDQIFKADKDELNKCVKGLQSAFERDDYISEELGKSKEIFNELKISKKNVNMEIEELRKDIQTNHPQIPCFISDHALVRYMESKDVDLSGYRREMLRNMHAAKEYKEVVRDGRPDNFNYEYEEDGVTYVYIVVGSVCTTCIVQGISNEDKGRAALSELDQDQ